MADQVIVRGITAELARLGDGADGWRLIEDEGFPVGWVAVQDDATTTAYYGPGIDVLAALQSAECDDPTATDEHGQRAGWKAVNDALANADGLTTVDPTDA